MKWNKRIIEASLLEAAHPRADGEGIRLRRNDGGTDHVTINAYGHITTYAAGRNWCDQAPHTLGSIFDTEHVENVVREIYSRRKEILSLNGERIRD